MIMKELFSGVVSTMRRKGYWKQSRRGFRITRHGIRNEMDAEEHRGVNSQRRENDFLIRHQMNQSKRMRGIEIDMRSTVHEDFRFTI